MYVIESCVLALAILCSVRAYPRYQEQIPNGDNVPHPCKVNYIWHGVGHKNPMGAGTRNSFGLDFEETHKWDRSLCEKDSDGDGRTNGEELGDPNCNWTPGELPLRVDHITHPGICDPWGSPECATTNSWVDCSLGEFECDAIKEPEVFNITLKYPETPVPNTTTNYMCMNFRVPTDRPFHLIATVPQIDNADIMHHMLLFGCKDNVEPTDEPYPCDMSAPGCFNTLGGWTVGKSGTCVNKYMGYRMGQGSFRVVSLQFHWNNPERRSDYTDGSGLTLYLTPKLRPNNGGHFLFGQMFLEIDPGQEKVVHDGTCSPLCTRHMITKPINITAGFNHMHYLGISQHIELFRDGEKVADLANDDHYNYDYPISHLHDPFVVMEPGDEVKTTCVYRSISRKNTVYFGQSTSDEMCFGFVTYFPYEASQSFQCVNWKELEFCGADEGYKCDIKRALNFDNSYTKATISNLLKSCNYNGKCRKECPAAIAEVKKNPCYHGEASEYILNEYAIQNKGRSLEFVLALKSCDEVDVSTASAGTSETSFLLLLCGWISFAMHGQK